MRASALDVVSMPAKMNVLRDRGQPNGPNAQKRYARHLPQQFVFWKFVFFIRVHVSLHCEPLLHESTQYDSESHTRTQLAHDIFSLADLLHDRSVALSHRPLFRLIYMSCMELDLVRDIPHAFQPGVRKEVDQPAAERGRSELVDKRYDSAEQP